MPRKQGKLRIVDSGSNLSTSKIVERIVRNRFDYMVRNKEKEKKEIDFLKNLDNETGSEISNSDANNNNKNNNSNHTNEAA